MRVLSKVLCVALLFALVTLVRAEEKKEGGEKTLTGTITCAKCDLKMAQKCATVIKVSEGGKDVIYYFDAKGDKANHKQICTEAKEGTVTGKVSKQGDKNIITVSKVDFK